MADRPILFSAPMIRALLAGTKTQTRRVVKPQPEFGLQGCHYSRTGWAANRDAEGIACTCQPARAPYGVRGDRLWVRETCRAEELDDGQDGVRYLADDAFRAIENTPQAGDRWSDLYHYGLKPLDRPIPVGCGKNVPAIHMPRWASRITLRITDIRVERLQDISEADAIAEGVCACDDGMWSRDESRQVRYHTAAMAYCDLWCEINGRDSWNANPWVWAVTFQRED